ERSHPPRPALPEDEVGLRAWSDAPEILAAESAGATEGGRVEDVRRRRCLCAALYGLRQHGGPAHRLDDTLRVGVGPEGHVDAGATIASERLHRAPAPGEDPDRVSHRAARFTQDPDVARRMIGPRRASHDDGVAEDRARAEEAQLLEPGDGRLAVTRHHLVE